MIRPNPRFILAQWAFYWFRSSDYSFEQHMLWEQIGEFWERHGLRLKWEAFG